MYHALVWNREIGCNTPSSLNFARIAAAKQKREPVERNASHAIWKYWQTETVLTTVQQSLEPRKRKQAYKSLS